MVNSGAFWARAGSDCRQGKRSISFSAASLSILGNQHNFADEPAIVLWNAASNDISTQ
jgi:hypothetical protein